MIEIKQIKPKNIKISDKYSANLYKYLKKHQDFHAYYNRNIGTFENPEFKELDWNDFNNADIYIGSNIIEDIWGDEKKIDFGQVIGKALSSITWGRKLNEQGAYCAFGGYYINRDWIDITDEFWNKYKEMGRCLFTSHDSYCEGNKNRFEAIDDNTIQCKWCGKIEHKHIKEIITYKEEWI
ncbi:hypothetical protein [Clostridium sp. ZBS18]|uniref:hypothetical protein n=1 Tax=Clostridium sp. ZBS18 TaxID=2949967 RepID=UPI00207957F8|nr:hypothetical protein [Clostridium sp. ZBS18]